MSHAAESVVIDPMLHHDLRAMASAHPAAHIATSRLAKALAADVSGDGQIANATLTAYASAIEMAALPAVTESAREALVTRLKDAFPGR